MEKLKESHHPLYKELVSILGSDHVTDEDFACWATVGDFTLEKPPESDLIGPPNIVVRPQNTLQVSRILLLANKTRTAVTVAGAKTGCGAANTPMQGGILLDMLDMNKVLKIDERSMAVLVQGGCTWSRMISELEKKGYTTGFRGPHGLISATVAGNIAYSSGGVRQGKFGWAGGEVLSLEVVLPNGNIIRTGSRALARGQYFFMRQGINGPDMAGIFIGSSGIFGVITEVALKIYPIPKCTQFQSYWFDSIEAGIKATYQLQKAAVWGTHLSDGLLIFGPSQRILVPEAPKEAQSVFGFCIEEDDEKVAEARKEMCDKIALAEGGKILGPDVGKRMAYDVQGRILHAMFSWSGCFMELIRFVPTLQVLEEYEAELKNLERLKDLVVKVPGTDIPASIGVGIIIMPQCEADLWAGLCLFDDSDPEIRRKCYELDKEWHYHSAVVLGGGIPSGLLGARGTPTFVKALAPQYLTFLRTIKRALDPNNVLNPGVLLLEG